jgi:hypothetical protein
MMLTEREGKRKLMNIIIIVTAVIVIIIKI